MKQDPLKSFLHLREALRKEKSEIEARLQEINSVLESASAGAGARRMRNEISLKEAIIKVTTEKPLNRHEILEAVEKLGYKFSTDNPLNSIGVVLYGKKPKFKKQGGRFTPA